MTGVKPSDETAMAAGGKGKGGIHLGQQSKVESRESKRRERMIVEDAG